MAAVVIFFKVFLLRTPRPWTLTSVLQVRQLDYVQAAIAVGASQFRIMLRHLIPNSLAPIIVETSVSLGFAILSESALSFLGLGTQPPNPSLGIMLSDGRAFISSAPWLALFPGMMIMISVLGFNLLGDGLRDIIDPKLRE
jgi:peptide/nickel transport system permease protein